MVQAESTNPANANKFSTKNMPEELDADAPTTPEQNSKAQLEKTHSIMVTQKMNVFAISKKSSNDEHQTQRKTKRAQVRQTTQLKRSATKEQSRQQNCYGTQNRHKQTNG